VGKLRIWQAGLLLLTLAAVAAGLSLLRRGGEAGAALLVQDQAGLLSPAERDQIADYHEAILEAYDLDYRVVVVTGAPDVDAAAVRHFADLEIGHLSTRGRGLLLLIAPETDKVRIEVGRSLEPVFTDAFVAYIEERQMVPFFRSNRVSDGILATTELIADRAGDGERTAAFADPAGSEPEPSAGGGARTAARIGAGYQRPQGDDAGVSAAGLAADEVVAAYVEAMAAGNASPELDIFTGPTREMMRNWVVTRAQMRNVVETYQRCGPLRLLQTEELAVVRYPADQRGCAPYLLRWSDGAWRLDLATMSREIRFNHRNEWHFYSGVPAEFAFGFEDWRFDRHGFPHR
jgi:uncharacterized protein